MADLMELARRSRASRRNESRESKESPPIGGSREHFACFPCGPVPWDPREALRLMEAADALVERAGVDGTLSGVRAAADAVTSAYVTRDLETLRQACAEFAAVTLGADTLQKRSLVKLI